MYCKILMTYITKKDFLSHVEDYFSKQEFLGKKKTIDVHKICTIIRLLDSFTLSRKFAF